MNPRPELIRRKFEQAEAVMKAMQSSMQDLSRAMHDAKIAFANYCLAIEEKEED